MIDDAPAVGLCGSGIIDVVAELYGAELINFRGRFEKEKDGVENGRYWGMGKVAGAAPQGLTTYMFTTSFKLTTTQLLAQPHTRHSIGHPIVCPHILTNLFIKLTATNNNRCLH